MRETQLRRRHGTKEPDCLTPFTQVKQNTPVSHTGPTANSALAVVRYQPLAAPTRRGRAASANPNQSSGAI